MQKLRIEDDEIMKIAIQQEISRSEESRYDHRLHAVLLVANGMSSYTVADFLGHHSSTVERWVNSFNRRGFAGLCEGERPGRPSRMSQPHWEALERDLRTLPREFGYAQNLWDGKLLSHHLWSQYRVKLGVRQCQRLFRKLGFRRRKPRGVIAHADPEAQAAYKKTPPSGTQ